jgi:hypothetical protein
MSLEHGPQRSRSKRSKRTLPPLFAADHPDQILTLLEWAAINRISERNARRILASGDGPAVVQLSAKRVGIRVGDNRAWQQARSRGGQAR